MENNNISDQTNVVNAANESGQTQAQQVQQPVQPPVQKPKADRSQITVRGKTIKITTVIKWAVILLVFLVATNPGIIPFLPADVKTTIIDSWSKVFGNVERISGTFIFNWATIFQVIAIIMMMILLTSLIRFIVQNIHPKSSKAKSALSLLNSAISYITALLCFFWCLAAIGVNVTAILASVGIVALIIGFGAQSLVEDLVTGIFLVFEDQFNVGDIIEAGGFRGVVEAIGIRTTSIRDMGGNIKIINNSDLRNVLNRSSAASFATTLVSVAYSTDLDVLEPKLTDYLPSLKAKYPDLFLEEPSYLGVQELSDSGVILKIGARVHEKDIYKAPRILNREIKGFFDKNNVEIPFPQVVVHNSDK